MNKKTAWAIFSLCIVGILVFNALFIWKNGRLPFTAQKNSDTADSIASATCAKSKIDLFGQAPDAQRKKLIAALLDQSSRSIFRARQTWQGNQTKKSAQQLQKLAITRKDLLVETMQRDPEAAFFSLLSQREFDVLAPLTTGCVETPVALEGVIEINHIDFINGSTQNRYSLVTDKGKRLVTLSPALGLNVNLPSGARVQITGYQIDDFMIFDGSDPGTIKIIDKNISWLTNTASAALPDAMGNQKTAVLLINFKNTSQPSLTKAQAQNVMSDQINAYYQEVSYQKTSFSADIFGWYQIPINQTCSTATTWAPAIAAADPDVDFTQYSRLVIIAPFGPSCAFTGDSSIGKIGISTAEGFKQMSISTIVAQYLSLRVAGHELGHALGVDHAGFLDCGNVSIALSGCTNVEYGNPYSIMGQLSDTGHHMDSYHKDYIGWFDAPNITAITANGTYVLTPLEATSTGLQALKIQRSKDTNLFIEYRQPIGFDNTFSSADFQGALMLIHDAFSGKSQLIDTTPPANNMTAVLPVGQSFIDPASGTTVKVLSRTNATLSVSVTLGKTDFTPPTLSITSPQINNTVSGTITVSANATDASGIEKVEFYKDCGRAGAPFATDTTAPYQASFDTTQMQDGSNYIKAVAYDLSGQSYGIQGNSKIACNYITVLNNSDITPPTISVMMPTNGSTVSSPVIFQVSAQDNIGIRIIEFYKDGESVPFATSTMGFVSASLSAGAHTFFARTIDTAGNTADSNTISFTISGGADTIAPTISITNPANGATVSGTSVTLSANATDNIGVSGVRFKVDGTNNGTEDTAAPYSIIWDSTLVANGAHTVTATARDATGNSATSSGIIVTVNNIVTDTILPTVSLVAPLGGSTVSGIVTISANATDNIAVQKVDFYRDASIFIGTDATNPYSINLDSTTVPNGNHTLFARASDTSSNQTSTLSRSVTVNNIIVDSMPPTIPTAVNAITTTSSSQITLTWSSSTDNTGVANYHIYRNNAPVGTSTATTYTDIGLSPNTAYTYTITAMDASGNISSASTPITVTTSQVNETSNVVAVKGTVSIAVVVSSNAQVMKVEFYQDTQTAPFATVNSAPFVTQWDTTSPANGAHAVSAKTYFADGKVTTSGITLNVQN